MKIRATFKDPEALRVDAGNDGVRDQIKDHLLSKSRKPYGFMTEDEKEEFEDRVDAEVAEFMEFVSKWVEWEELITIEFDTKAKTAVVIKTGK